MKLTREGAARLGRHESRGFPVGDFEFLPEDFDGCFQNEKDHIALTTEEAEILTRCAANEFYRLIMERGPVDLTRQVEVLMYDLIKRIAEVKAVKIGNDYNKALTKVIETFQEQAEKVDWQA